MLDVAQEGQIVSEKATVLQAAWRRRNVQGKFQTAVQEMMEINGLIEDIEKKEEELKAKQEATALQIEKVMAQDLKEEPPPKMPSEKDMKDPAKMQEYMLQVGQPMAAHSGEGAKRGGRGGGEGREECSGTGRACKHADACHAVARA